MSTNTTNQNNNETKRNNHGGRHNNFNGRNKTRQPKVNPNEFKIPLYLPADLNENVSNEIIDLLNNTKFNKISIPIGVCRGLIDASNPNDTRISTIGYIRNYNAETEEFTVIIFDKFVDLIKSNGEDNVVELMFTTYKDSLGTITKFNISTIVEKDECEDCDDDVNIDAAEEE